jgi:hypothetical protein
MKQKMGFRAQIRDLMQNLEIRSPDISQWYIRNGILHRTGLCFFWDLVPSVESHGQLFESLRNLTDLFNLTIHQCSFSTLHV